MCQLKIIDIGFYRLIIDKYLMLNPTVKKLYNI